MGKIEHSSGARRGRPRLDAMTLVEEHVGTMFGDLAADEIGYPGQLLIGDQHEPRVAGQVRGDPVAATAEAGEPALEIGYTLAQLLVPGCEGVLGRDHQQPISLLAAMEEPGEPLGRLAGA